MHSQIIYNHRLLQAAKARLPALTSATLYGRGVFTTLAIYHHQPFLWTRHWARLIEQGGRVGVKCDALAEDAVRASLTRLIKANKVADGRARLTLWSRELRGPWKPQTENETSETNETATDLLIMTGDARAVPDEGLALTVSPYRANTLSPLAGLKTLNYLAHILSWEEAHTRDFDEAVVFNERGEVVSATLANIFWVKHGTVYTPALSTSALAGTTRAVVLELAAQISVPLVEGVYDLAHLADADEIFLTSSGLGVALVHSFDFHRYTVTMDSITRRFHEAFRQLTLHT